MIVVYVVFLWFRSVVGSLYVCQEKDRKEAERKAAKEAKAAKTAASQALARLGPLSFRLANSLEDGHISDVPNFARDGAKAAVKTLEACSKECKQKLAQDAPSVLSFDAKETAARATSALTTLDDLLKAVKRHQV